MKTAYSYIRFSSAEQKKGASYSRQDKAEEWCETNGFTLSDDRFFDAGKSAFKGKHLGPDGDLKRFLSLVESRRIRPGSALIIESYDRLSRLPLVKSVTLFLNIINSGIGIVFLMTHGQKLITEKNINDEPYILYSILGEAQRAYSESKHKSERVKDACDKRKQRAISSGVKILSWCPPWCSFENGSYVIDETRAKIVKRVYDEYLSGNGPYRIARKFNLEQLPTLGHRGTTFYRNTKTEWYKKTIRDLLMDKRVFGFAEHLNKDNYYPVIISKDKFNQVQNRLALRAAEPATGGPVERVSNLFTGLCRCANCGQVMTHVTTRKTYKSKTTSYAYLVCEGAKAGTGCGWKSVPYQFIEDTFFQVLDQPEFYGAMTNTNLEAENRLASLQGELVTIEKQIEKLSKMVLNDDNPSTTLVSQLKQFEAKKVAAEKAIKLATAQVQPLVDMGDAMELKNSLNDKSKDPAFRLKIREYIRNWVKSIKLDTKSDFTNYQVEFKSGNVCSVVLWKVGKKDSDGVSFQIFSGVRRVVDWNAVIYGT